MTALRCWFLPLALCLAISLSTWSAPVAGSDAGRRLVFASDKGHCLDCHQLPNDPAARTRATVGPILKDLRTRFPDRSALLALLRDARNANPNTIMPPYGTHRILTDAELAAVADYLLTQ